MAGSALAEAEGAASWGTGIAEAARKEVKRIKKVDLASILVKVYKKGESYDAVGCQA